jgi:HEPN domain-containing protein
MKRLTRQWVSKAEGDFQIVGRELRARINPNFDAACFHAQQCIEKYLKARLQEENIAFPRTHDLGQLLDLAKSVEPLWEGYRSGLNRLNVFGVRVRYPGTDATRDMAKQALRISREIRGVIRQSLDLKP